MTSGAGIEAELFGRRAGALWEKLDRPGPGRSWVTWFAAVAGRTTASVYNWRNGTSPVPRRASEALASLEQALDLGLFDREPAASQEPPEISADALRVEALEAELEESRAELAEARGEIVRLGRRVAEERALVEARARRRDGGPPPASFASIDEFEGAIRLGMKALYEKAGALGRRGEAFGAEECEESARQLGRFLDRLEEANRDRRRKRATAVQRRAAENGTAKAPPADL